MFEAPGTAIWENKRHGSLTFKLTVEEQIIQLRQVVHGSCWATCFTSVERQDIMLCVEENQHVPELQFVIECMNEWKDYFTLLQEAEQGLKINLAPSLLKPFIVFE